MKKNTLKNTLIFNSLALVFTLFMSIGYSAITKQLTITSDVAYKGKQGIFIASVQTKNASSMSLASFSDNTIRMTRPSSGSGSIDFVVVIRNKTDKVKVVSKINTDDKDADHIVLGNIDNAESYVGKKIQPHSSISLIFSYYYPAATSSSATVTFTFSDYAKTYLATETATGGTSGFYFNCSGLERYRVGTVKIETNASAPDPYTYNNGNTNIYVPLNIKRCDVSADKSGRIYLSWNPSLSYYNVTIHTVDDKLYTQIENKIGYQIPYLSSFDTTGLDTSELTSMKYMFAASPNLTSLNLSGFNTSNVTDFQHMFDGDKNLTSINMSGWNTANATNMSHMFANCDNLVSVNDTVANQYVNLSNFNTSKVTDISYMFGNCYKIKRINLSSFDTSNVTDMSGMFVECNELTAISDTLASKNYNLTNFDTQKVTRMNVMFLNNQAVVKIDLSSFRVIDNIIIAAMFDGDTNLTTIYASPWLRGKDNMAQIYSVTPFVSANEAVFTDCKKLKGPYASFSDSTEGMSRARFKLGWNASSDSHGSTSNGYLTCKSYGTHTCTWNW